MKNLTILTVAITAAILAGCASIQPGADPLVVRTEQLETTANASFQLIVSVDNADRGFWITNAPAFHNFAEWLRTSVPTPTNPNEPRGLGLILLVDADKEAYIANKALSNNLLSAISDLQFAANQATAWQTIISTNN